ncbi:MAG: hypothetical protein ABS987_02330, partial [Ruminococcus sp.]
ILMFVALFEQHAFLRCFLRKVIFQTFTPPLFYYRIKAVLFLFHFFNLSLQFFHAFVVMAQGVTAERRGVME